MVLQLFGYSSRLIKKGVLVSKSFFATELHLLYPTFADRNIVRLLPDSIVSGEMHVRKK